MIGDLAAARAAAVAADPRHARIETIRLLCDCQAGAPIAHRRHGGPLGICDYTPNPIGPPVYLCPSCRRFFPWCRGAASDRPELCDDCWADASEGDTTP